MGMVSSNRQMESLEIKTRSGLLSVHGRKVGRDHSARWADTGKIAGKVSIHPKGVW